ncbi:penicillin-binding protein PBP2A [Streptococcus sp. DD13]|uniref:penicillin-binding protein PBP2A n=1 Tax=Streptococcus sp. DD13 TaxID=1777881 RepID=UPI000794CAD5|nr:penicillin-binding protein PBP2A [Streptococcus sp. DD13]KXT77707.1 Multimodular transpeptidase-transglycosylase [Streptococcus sp. DD13]
MRDDYDYPEIDPYEDTIEAYEEIEPTRSRSRRKSGPSDKPRKEKKTAGPFKRFWKRYQLTKILLIITGLFIVVVGGYLFYLAKTANVGDLQAALKAQTIIYDKDENEAGTLTGQKGTYVELSAIGEDLQHAVIATEDRSFYKNSGVNFGRTLLALATFGKSGGGSTITQQLAKNAYLSQEQTISRKAREFFLAMEINKKYSKDEILTMYLNNAYFGNGVWGVEDASQKYFGTNATGLTLGQSALIAGMLKGPEIYNPYASIEQATNRRNTVLGVMVDAGYISQAQADQAKQEDLSSQLKDTYVGKKSNYAYPSYFDAVISEAEERYGLSESDIINNGYRIYTEMDQTSQANMQAIYDEKSLFPVASDGEYAQSASVAVDPTTGGVRALVGRVGSSNASFRSFNFATQAQRSPGSTIKPLIDYAPAIEQGWKTTTLLDNHTETYGSYHLQNYDRTTSEDVPMYQALAQSLNLPAVYTANKLGLDTVFSYGNRFGLNMDKVDKNLAVAIGSEVTTNPLQMAQAYSAFANGGQMKDAHLIKRIETANGKVLKTHEEKTTQVISSSTADQMTSMMLGTFTNGTGVTADVYGYDIAGKTGTTETSFDGSLTNDQWVIGYTKDIVIAQWVGFEKTDQTHYIDANSTWMSANIFRNVAATILPQTAATKFNVTNAYYQNGYQSDTSSTTSDNRTQTNPSQEQSWTDRAKGLIENARQGIEDADIPGKAKNLWDSFVGLFQ